MGIKISFRFILSGYFLTNYSIRRESLVYSKAGDLLYLFSIYRQRFQKNSDLQSRRWKTNNELLRMRNDKMAGWTSPRGSKGFPVCTVLPGFIIRSFSANIEIWQKIQTITYIN